MDEKELKQVKDFLKMMQGRLDYAFEKQDDGNYDYMEKLYTKYFTLSFMGKTCQIPFGANEYQSIEQALQNILDEWE